MPADDIARAVERLSAALKHNPLKRATPREGEALMQLRDARAVLLSPAQKSSYDAVLAAKEEAARREEVRRRDLENKHAKDAKRTEARLKEEMSRAEKEKEARARAKAAEAEREERERLLREERARKNDEEAVRKVQEALEKKRQVPPSDPTPTPPCR